MKETEAHIQRAILDWGQYNGILMHRINVIGTPYQKGGLTFYRPASNVGMADILATHVVGKIPIPVWLEVKSRRGKLSDKQRIFRDTVVFRQGHHYVVRSVKDVEDALKEVEAKTWAWVNKYHQKRERENGGTT